VIDLSKIRPMDQADVKGKRVLVRVDLNVPMQDGRVSDMTRIERVAPTIRLLAERDAKVVVISHFGRPKGPGDKSLSLGQLVQPLSETVGRPVAFAADCIGEPATNAVAALKPGQIVLLENLRFHPEEEANDAGFSAKLASLGDLYVGDAFSCAHRAHASTFGVPAILSAFAGPLMGEEIGALARAVDKPERLVAALVGGAKVSSKLKVLSNLVGRVDKLIIGGGMANTFLFALGHKIGGSLCEKDLADTALAVIKTAEARGCEILLPVDVVIAEKFAAGAPSKVVGIDDVPDGWMILDVGPATAKKLGEALGQCRTMLWNGPLGAFEIEPFDQGTTSVAKAAAELTARGSLVTVAGGGDTVSALNHAGVADAFSYVSTAGGAFLEYLEGIELPGVAALAARPAHA
jgi:phosphoglycerate kinase